MKRKIIDHFVRRRPDGRTPVEEILAIIDASAGDERTFTRRLVAVRMHHELTRLARSGYYQLVETLGYADN